MPLILHSGARAVVTMSINACHWCRWCHAKEEYYCEPVCTLTRPANSSFNMLNEAKILIVSYLTR